MFRFAALFCTIAFASPVLAQFPQPSAEHKIIQKDVGTWDAKITMWMGPDGTTDPGATPQVSQGKEVNRPMGEFWVISDFKGDFAGMPFEGHAVSGYDPAEKKFVGTWTDSMTPSPMQMVGSYDPTTKTLTSMTKGIGMDGKPTLGKSVMKYNDDGSRTLTMFDVDGDKQLKSMQIDYTVAASKE